MGSAPTPRRYGIKLIWPTHVTGEHPYFERSLGEELPALMNFSGDASGRKLASSITIGDRALVYVTEIQRFIWAIEFIGTLGDGEAARRRHGIRPGAHGKFSIYLPIRFLARVEPIDNAPTRAGVCDASGVPFAPEQGDSYVPLSRDDYERMYRGISWTAEYK